jgi:hypothetical protein
MRQEEHPSIFPTSLTLCTLLPLTNRTRIMNRTPTESISFMKPIGTDTLVVFILLVEWRMEIKVTWTSMFHDFRAIISH